MKIKKEFVFVCFMVLFATFISFTKPKDNIVYLYPGCWGFREGKEDLCMYGINLSEECRKKGLKLRVTTNLSNLQNVNKIILFELYGYDPFVLQAYPKDKLSLFLWEPPVTVPVNYQMENHEYFSKIFTWDDSLVDNQKYFKFFYPELGTITEDLIPFSEKKLCCFIGRNKFSFHPAQLYGARIACIKFFEITVPDSFDHFGIGWNGEYFKSYKGAIPDKNVLKNYKFSICFENGKDIPGYVTEKIFNCFQNLCVPIYLGANNITDYVPENCFIDMRKFSGFQELLSFLQNMTEEQYLQYLQNIRDYYRTEKAKLFGSDHFKEVFLKAIE